MSKYLLVLLLLTLNTYANKDWIKFDSKENDKNQNGTELKMYNSTSSLKGISTLDKTSSSKNTKNPDRDLIEAVKKFQEVAQKIHSKIRK